MTVVESRRPRHLLIRLARGDELPSSLAAKLDEIEVRGAWITGLGSLEAVEVTVPAAGGAIARRLETPCELVSLSGSLSRHQGAGRLRLAASLARETDVGLEVLGGQLVWGRVASLELFVVALDDVELTASVDPAEAVRGAAAPPIAHLAPVPVEGSRPAAFAPGFSSTEPGGHGPPVPVRLHRPRDDVEAYPEPGDLVHHFHFGDCTVIDSDGERIRLRQERDGRVREVALSMLRIENPTTDPASGKRHFRLARKN